MYRFFGRNRRLYMQNWARNPHWMRTGVPCNDGSANMIRRLGNRSRACSLACIRIRRSYMRVCCRSLWDLGPRIRCPWCTDSRVQSRYRITELHPGTNRVPPEPNNRCLFGILLDLAYHRRWTSMYWTNHCPRMNCLWSHFLTTNCSKMNYWTMMSWPIRPCPGRCRPHLRHRRLRWYDRRRTDPIAPGLQTKPFVPIVSSVFPLEMDMDAVLHAFVSTVYVALLGLRDQAKNLCDKFPRA